jgi:hypothetical protein
MWDHLEASIESCFVAVGHPPKFVLDPFALLRTVADARTKPVVLAEVGESLLSEAEGEAHEMAKSAIRTFDGDLREFCDRERVSVAGRFPIYVLGGFLRLRLDIHEGTSRVGTKKVKSLLAARVWLTVVAELKKEDRRIITPEDFLASCEVAYSQAIAARDAKVGASIHVRDLFRELRLAREKVSPTAGFKPKRPPKYTEEHFKRDLARLIAAGRFVSKRGAKMELMPTAFSKDGIPVTVGEGVRYIGRVSFGEPAE